MKNNRLFKFLIFGCMGLLSCSHNGFKNKAEKSKDVENVLFLHHSTGGRIYRGGMKDEVPVVKRWFENYNDKTTRKINFVEESFPKKKRFKIFGGYGWQNYPYDYYNIWVKNGDKKSYKDEPTLKLLAPLWDVIVFKHCFPVSGLKENGTPDIDSPLKTIENYKLQYVALKKKMKEYPDTKFILWTGAALVEKNTDENSAKMANEFFSWVKEEWDVPGDNIYLWDFYDLETEGGLYLKNENAASVTDSHPGQEFSERIAPLFCNRIVDVIQNNGENTNLKGEEVVVESL